MVIRRLTASNETHQLEDPEYLALDWNQILCPTNEDEQPKIRRPWRLCYDEEQKQLIVGDYYGVNVHTLSRY